MVAASGEDFPVEGADSGVAGSPAAVAEDCAVTMARADGSTDEAGNVAASGPAAQPVGSDSADDVLLDVLPGDTLSDGESEDDGEAVGDVVAAAGGSDGTAESLPPAPPLVLAEDDSRAPCVPGSRLPQCTSIFRDEQDLYAYLLLRGAKQLTEELYDMVRAGFNLSTGATLPSLSYVRGRIAPLVSSWLLPVCTADVPLADGNGIMSVKYIQPSAHVRRDIAFAETCRLFSAAGRRSNDDRVLEPEFVDSPFFNDRAKVLLSGATVQRFILDGQGISVGDTVDLILASPLPRVRIVVADAHFCSYLSGVGDDGELHAGDFVIVGSGDESGTLVTRQWSAIELPVITWLPDSDSSTAREVQRVVVVASAGDTQAPTENGASANGGDQLCSGSRRATTGVKDGERFIIVSICFNSDDFEARRGKSASLGGVYMSYLSLLYEDRRSSGASRTIAATPPGVDSDHVLRAITPDLVHGATVGWLCRASDGTAVRVFADVCMFVGDYLQVSKTSMMLGYSAKSPCPLCDYRIPAIPGSKYGHMGSSAEVSMARTTARTTSICSAVRVGLSSAGDE